MSISPLLVPFKVAARAELQRLPVTVGRRTARMTQSDKLDVWINAVVEASP